MTNLDKTSTTFKTTDKTADFFNDTVDFQFVLLNKTLCYHWNVRGPRFHAIHVFLEEHYKQLLTMIDATAERLSIIGGRPLAPLKSLKRVVDGNKSFSPNMNANDMMQDLATEHGHIITSSEKFLDASEKSLDPGTEDLIIENLRKHQSMHWMLRSHLEQ